MRWGGGLTFGKSGLSCRLRSIADMTESPPSPTSVTQIVTWRMAVRVKGNAPVCDSGNGGFAGEACVQAGGADLVLGKEGLNLRVRLVLSRLEQQWG